MSCWDCRNEMLALISQFVCHNAVSNVSLSVNFSLEEWVKLQILVGLDLYCAAFVEISANTPMSCDHRLDTIGSATRGLRHIEDYTVKALYLRIGVLPRRGKCWVKSLLLAGFSSSSSESFKSCSLVTFNFWGELESELHSRFSRIFLANSGSSGISIDSSRTCSLSDSSWSDSVLLPLLKFFFFELGI